jgi:hypothetical protein
LNDILEEKLFEPEACLVFNPYFYLRGHANREDIYFYKRGNTPMAEVATFAYFGKRKEYVNDALVVSAPCVETIETSNCGRFWYVSETTPLSDDDKDIYNSCLNERIETCCRVVVEDMVLQQPIRTLVTRVKAYYKKHYCDFAGLENWIRSYILSDECQAYIEERLDQLIDINDRRLKIQFKAVCARHGICPDTYKPEPPKKLEMWLTFLSAFAVAFIIPDVNAPLPGVSVNLLTLIPLSLARKTGFIKDLGWLSKLVLVTLAWLNSNFSMFAYIYWGFMDPVVPTLTREIMRTVVEKEQMGRFHGFFQPASKVALKKTRTKICELETELASDVKLKTNYEKTDEPVEEELEIYGTTIEGSPFVVPVSDAQNLEAALRKRMCAPKTVDQDVVDRFLKHAKHYIDTCMPDFDLCVDDVEEFLIGQYGTKRGEKLAELIYEDITEDDLVYNMFVKNETYLGKDEDSMKARMIWSCPEIVIAKYSAYFNQLSKQLTKLWNGVDSDIFYTNCSSPDSVGRFAEKLEEWAGIYESDVSSWDGSLSNFIIELEKYFIEQKVNGLPDDFDVLLDNWTRLHGKSRKGEVEVVMDHGRRSGDLWTSAFNSLLNVLITTFCYDVEAEDEFAMMVLGDDNVFATCLDVDLSKVELNYKSLGMKCTIVPRESMAEASYCSGRFWIVDDGYKWGNLPLRTLTKFGFNYGKHHKKHHKKLLNGIAKGMLPTARHVPILGAFLQAISDSCDEKDIGRMKPDGENPYRIQGGIVTEPSESTYIQFSMLYGVSYLDIKFLEDYILENITIDSFPGIIRSAEILSWATVDYDFSPLESGVTVLLDPDDEEFDIKADAVKEEVGKIAWVSSVKEALLAGWQYGKEEDDEFGTSGHAFLHAFFSILSYINLSLGVHVHYMYNVFVFKMQEKFMCSKRRNRAIQGKKKKKNRQRQRRKKTEKKWYADIGKAALTKGGSFLGGLLPIPGASTIGGKIGGAISKIIGWGDYEVNSNTLLTGDVPQFGANKHSTTISHKEYLGDVVGSSAFTKTDYTINPGIFGTFPWLSKMAGLYTQYTIHGMIFEFKSTSATAIGSTNTALGTVIMATRYNTYNNEFTSKIEMENHEFSTSCKPADSCMHPIECAPDETPYLVHFVRSHALASGEDERLYDWGIFSIATVGMQAAATIGELWISYDITFSKPRLNPGSYPNPLHARIANGPASLTNPLGDIQRGVGGNLPITITATGSGWDTINFPSYVQTGRYLVIFHFKDESDTYSLTYTNCQLATSGYGFDQDGVWYVNNDDGTSTLAARLVDITGFPASIQVNPTTTWTGTDVDVYVLQMPEGSAFPLRSASLFSYTEEEFLTDEKTPEEEEYQMFLAWRKSRKCHLKFDEL